MKIGCCIPGGSFMPEGVAESNSNAEVLLESYRLVKAAGYDYVECCVGMVMQLSEKELQLLEEEKEKGAFSIEACNSFIPPEYHVAEAAELPKLTVYVEEAMRRMSRLGVEIVVFGSGAARMLPGKDFGAEFTAIEEFLRMCNEKAAAHRITIGIEPLNRGECNVINSVGEAAALVRKLELPQVKLLADCFHMFKEEEDLGCLEANKDILRHTHVAEVPARVYPGRDGGAYIKEFGKHLKNAGYEGRVSVECGYDEFAKDIQLAYPTMKEAFLN